MTDLTSAEIDGIMNERRADLSAKLRASMQATPDAEHCHLPPGYIAHSVADLRALRDMLTVARHRELVNDNGEASEQSEPRGPQPHSAEQAPEAPRESGEDCAPAGAPSGA